MIWMILSTVLLACSEEATVEQTPIEAAVAALGGEQAITALTSYRITGNGKTFEPGQTVRTSDPPIAAPSYSFNRIEDTETDRVRIDYVREPGEPFFLPFEYGAVLEPNAGLFAGVSGWVAQVSHVPEHSMRADRRAAMGKTERLGQPQQVLLEALHQGARTLPDETYAGRAHHVYQVDDPNGPMRIFIDDSTHLPSKVDTLEDDPVLGDVLVEARFDEWSEQTEVKLPGKVRYYDDGLLIREETRSEVRIEAVDDSEFPPAETEPDPELTALARDRSAFYDRYLSAALEMDSFPAPPNAVILTEIGAGSKIYHITGAIHNALAIEMDASIVMVEAPIDDARSIAIMDAVRRQIPNKPITHLINTHHHHDHSGGARAYIAEGATIVTATENEAFFREMAAAPHTVLPDSLANDPKELSLLLVGPEPTTIRDGREVQILRIETRHSEGMLMVYVPDSKLLFQSDLYAPGLGMVFGSPLMNPPVGRLFVEGAGELHDALTASGLPVEVLVGGHGPVAGTMAQLKADAGR